MGKRELWVSLNRRPSAVRYEELAKLLEWCGFEHARRRGSHHTFSGHGRIVTVPERRPHVLPVYVKDALRRTKEYLDD